MKKEVIHNDHPAFILCYFNSLPYIGKKMHVSGLFHCLTFCLIIVDNVPSIMDLLNLLIFIKLFIDLHPFCVNTFVKK